MNNLLRTAIVIACALFGGFVSVTFLPPVLTNLYDNLRQINQGTDVTNAETSIEPSSVNRTQGRQTGSENPSEDPETITSDPDSAQESNDGEPGSETAATDEQSTDDGESSLSDGQEQQFPESDASPSQNTSGLTINDTVDEGPAQAPINIPALALFGAIVGAAIGALILRKFDDMGSKWEKMAPGDKVTVVVGSTLGFFAGLIISLPFQVAFQGKAEGAIISVGLVVGCSALSVYIFRTMSDILPWETTVHAKKRTGIKVFDTNVLIDGRVYDLVRTGFIDGEIYIPKFVLLELQHIADSADSLRRQRGRRGLDVLKRIQSEFEVTVGEHDRYAGNEKDEVDDRLVKLAKAIGGDLVSNDFNLNRVADIQDVRVLNINELALALRPTILPGEPVQVTVVKEGNQYGQGVGYLDDGTMVVVEHGYELIGETVSVPVSQVIQTERGKMLFADGSNPELPNNQSDPPADPAPRKRAKKSR